jgi:6-phosphogluconolactonase (cycloisomerase 2 family)
VTRQDGGSVAGFRLNPDGSRVPVPGSPFKTSHSPSVVRSDPQGRFLFIGENNIVPGTLSANCAGQRGILAVDRVDPTSGVLMQVSSVTLRGSCVRDIAVDPSGTHLYVGVENITTSGGAIHEFLIGASGVLAELVGSPVMAEGLPISFAMHPSGRFLYAATPSLTVLDRNIKTGELSVRGVFSTPKRQLALNATGTLLIAGEQEGSEASEFQLDTGGNVVGERRQPAKAVFPFGSDPLIAVVTPH